ncbi:hypothetical protein [Candidatus Parabeggiatoa sp. HSG14]|nr:hypothetical protein [Thiotrichales bacterium HSG14]
MSSGFNRLVEVETTIAKHKTEQKKEYKMKSKRIKQTLLVFRQFIVHKE